MSEIKQINTGVAELLAVKVPEGITGWAAGNGCVYFNSIGVKLIPYGDYEALGLSTELTEEQCREVMPLYKGDYMTYINNEVDAHDTAKEAFASLMQANGCYSVNPYRKPNPIDVLSIGTTKYHIATDQWQQSEANTGTRLILKKYKDV